MRRGCTSGSLACSRGTVARSLEGDDDAPSVLAEEQPALASLYDASASDRQLLGEAPGQATRKLVRAVREVVPPGEALADVGGVNVHAGAAIDGRDRKRLERRNERARTVALGSRDCRAFSLVLGPASLATTQPELVRALRAMPRAGRGKLGPIYVGELDGTLRLVAYARAPTVDAAHALRDAAAAATGLDVRTDCRVPLVATMVSRGRSK